MSCQLKLCSKIQDIARLKRYLHPNEEQDDEDSHQETGDVDWQNEDWGWEDQTTPSVVIEEDDQWLNDCEVAVSPLADLLVVAYKDRLAIFQSCFDDDVGDGGEVSMDILWKGVVSKFPRELITSVFCLPLISYKQSSHGGTEWTCVIVGFNTGHVRMYTETGTLVLDQMLHNESVMSIKCKTYSAPRYTGSSDLHEELSILYETVLVTLDGFGFFQTLRACRNQAALAAASGSKRLELPPLAYKKWGLKEQVQANDHVSTGSYTPNPYDQMQAATMFGFSEQVSAVPPTSYLYSTCGDGPYLGVYHAFEGDSNNLLSDVTQAATKLLSVGASALVSWGTSFLRKPAAQSEQQKTTTAKVEPATGVTPRFQLIDKQRIGRTMALSPMNTIAAVTDTLGRVLLVDVQRGVIKRMWKGYRNAQVGWVTVKESSSTAQSTQRRHAHFLLIYAPKRGLLEVWLSENGPRVGAFNVGKNCRLLYPGCTLLGLNSSTYRYVKRKTVTCLLLSSAGELVNIDVPFHLALSDANSKHAHDEQLYRLIKATLRKFNQDSQELADELWENMCKLKLASSLQHALEKILSYEHVTELSALALLNNISEHVHHQFVSPTEEGEEQVIDVESRLLLDFCSSQTVLIGCHTSLLNLSSSTDEASSMSADSSIIVPREEVEQSLSNAFVKHEKKKVKFATSDTISLAEFLSYFEYEQSYHMKPSVRELDAQQMHRLGQLTLAPVIYNGVLLEKLRVCIGDLELSNDFIHNMLLFYYLGLDDVTESTLVNLHIFLDDIINVTSGELPSTDNSLMPFWIHTRSLIEASRNFRNSLHIALCCRSICLKKAQALEESLTDSVEANDSEAETDSKPSEQALKKARWELPTLDIVMWNACVKHIEDVSALNMVLTWSPEGSHVKAASEDVTVKALKQGHKGLVSELVGRWCVRNRLSPTDVLKYQTQPCVSSKEECKVVAPLCQLQRTFPLSLSLDAIFANGSWEFASLWNRDVEAISNIRMSLDYLNHIENGCLRHGLCLLMWRTFFVKKLSALVALVEKVGKVPKDRLCKKEVEMDTALTTEFTTVMCDYMEIFLQSNCDFGEPMLYRCEPEWEEEIASGQSLLDMASQQRETNYRLLHHHFLLMRLLNAIMVFSMKSVKIMALFDHNGVAACFKDLNSHPYLSPEGKNDVISSNRKLFLCRVLRLAVKDLPSHDQILSPGGSLQIDRTSDAMKWPHHVLRIAEAFCLDCTCLKSVHIKELFSHGYDKLGFEVLMTFPDQTDICTQLLDICAVRVNHVITNADQEKSASITSSISPAMLAWLREREQATVENSNVPTYETQKLLSHIVRVIQEPSAVKNFAGELLTLASTLL